MINGVPNKCGDDCTFDYSGSTTPVVSEVSVSNADSGDSITITGVQSFINPFTMCMQDDEKLLC